MDHSIYRKYLTESTYLTIFSELYINKDTLSNDFSKMDNLFSLFAITIPFYAFQIKYIPPKMTRIPHIFLSSAKPLDDSPQFK